MLLRDRVEPLVIQWPTIEKPRFAASISAIIAKIWGVVVGRVIVPRRRSASPRRRVERRIGSTMIIAVGAHETIVSEKWSNMPSFALRFYSRMLSVVKGNDAGLKGF